MPVDIRIQVGRRIRYLRTRKGITQAVLADHAEITRIALSRIENGKSEAGLQTLYALAKGMGITLAELMSGVI